VQKKFSQVALPYSPLTLSVTKGHAQVFTSVICAPRFNAVSKVRHVA
jgi:hypothetical protein